MIVNTAPHRVFIFEPSPDESRKQIASIFGGKKIARKTLAEIKEALKEIRVRNRQNLEENIERFKKAIKNFAHLKIHFAKDPKDFLTILKENQKKKSTISLNKSNVVLNEIRPYLRREGYKSYIRYFSEFENFHSEKKFFLDYWMLPGMHEKNIVEKFDVKESLDLSVYRKGRDYVAILGVNAASAETGNLYFLQHMSNIAKDVLEASSIYFVVPLEKIVENDKDAMVQTNAMGVFGLESILLDLKPKKEEIFDFEGIPFANGKKDVNVVVFDNGRSGLLSTPFLDLLLCIDCRACARQCPVGQHLPLIEDIVYSPKNLLLLHLQGALKPFELCLHCGRCEVECPVGIEIPSLLWKAQLMYYEKKGRAIIKRMLDNPELLAKVGVFFSPFSNWALKLFPLRLLMWLVPGIHIKAKLPTFSTYTFRKWYKSKKRDE